MKIKLPLEYMMNLSKVLYVSILSLTLSAFAQEVSILEAPPVSEECKNLVTEFSSYVGSSDVCAEGAEEVKEYRKEIKVELKSTPRPGEKFVLLIKMSPGDDFGDGANVYSRTDLEMMLIAKKIRWAQPFFSAFPNSWFTESFDMTAEELEDYYVVFHGTHTQSANQILEIIVYPENKPQEAVRKAIKFNLASEKKDSEDVVTNFEISVIH